MMIYKEYRRFMVSISSNLHEGTLLNDKVKENVLTIFSTERKLAIRSRVYFPDILHYKPLNIFSCERLVLTRHVTECAPAKTGQHYSDILPVFRKIIEG